MHIKTFKQLAFLACLMATAWGINALRIYRGTDNLGDVMVRCSAVDAKEMEGIEVAAVSPWATRTTMTSDKPGIWEIPRQEKRFVKEIRISNITPHGSEAAQWQISLKDKTCPEWVPLIGEPAGANNLTLRLPSDTTKTSLLPARRTTINWLGDGHLFWLSGMAVIYLAFAIAAVAIVWQNRKSWCNWPTEERTPASRSGYLLPLGAALVTALVLIPFASRGVDFHHDGIMLKPALDVLSGQTLFRDTFSQYGALTTYLHALALKVHPSLLSLRLVTVLAYSVAAFFLVSAWLMFLPRKLAVIAYLLFLVFIPYYDSRWLLLPWSSAFALMFQSISILGLLKCVQGEKPMFWGTIVGSSIACVFWCRQPVGVVLCAAIVFVFVVLNCLGWSVPQPTRRRIWKSLVVSFLAVHVIFISHLMVSGALDAWWYQNIVWPKAMYINNALLNGSGFSAKIPVYVRPHDGLVLILLFLALCLPLVYLHRKAATSLRHASLILFYYTLFLLLMFMSRGRVLEIVTFPSGWDGGAHGYHGGFMFLVPLIVVLGGGYFLPRYVLCRGSNDTKLNFVFALVCVSGASLLQYYPEPGLCHVFWSVAPGLGVFTYFIWKLLGLRHGAAALVIALMFLPPTIQKAHLGCTNLLRPLSELNEPSVLSGMKVPAPLAEYIGVLDSATRSILDKYPNTPIVVKGDDALYATFAKNHWNASPYCIEWAGLMSGQKLNLKLEEIHKRRPIVLFQKIPYSDKDAVSLDTVMPFNKSENYAVIAEIPFQPLRWWWGGQQEKDMVTVDSPLRSMVVVAPQELLPEKNSQ